MNQNNQPPGAFVHARFNLSEGDDLYMLIGQEGENACMPRSEPKSQLLKMYCSGKPPKPQEGVMGGGGGGGGATYVWKKEAGKDIPLLVAAGGGGSAIQPSMDPGKYSYGMTATNDHLDPVNGNSYFVGDSSGGGGGWNSSIATHDPKTGYSALANGRGGKSCNDIHWDTYGGFGGGGGPCSSGGGGGGYRGGDAPNTSQKRDGNGGNSYISNLRVGKEDISDLGSTGENYGNGDVTIQYHKLSCICEGAQVCTINKEYPSGWECICPANHILNEDNVCVDTTDMTQNNRIEIFAATCIIVAAFCLFGAGIVCYWIRRRNCRPGGDHSNELQPRNIGGAMVTVGNNFEFNPHYEQHFFGSWAYTPQDLSHIPRDKLNLAKALGQGAFGEVYQGFISGLPGGELNGPVDMPVAVKTLPELSTEQAEVDFLMEALIMSKFSHPNIVHCIGVCFEKHPRFIVLELLGGGDLKTFLRESRAMTEEPNNLSIGDLILMAIDVAKGCEYLEENHFIHRDIAARNCLLTSKRSAGRSVKIADFGMARDIYRNDYYRKGGKAMLPIKWMPPEAYLEGVFTSKTDVWSFGILLWEVFSLGYVPYPGLCNQEVMNLVVEGGRMDAPKGCPPLLYQIMSECWHRQHELRPNFAMIIERLQYCLQDPEVVHAPLPSFELPTYHTTMSREPTVQRSKESHGGRSMALKPKNQPPLGGGAVGGSSGGVASQWGPSAAGRAGGGSGVVGGVAGGGGGGGGGAGGGGKTRKQQPSGGKETLINDPSISPKRPLLDGMGLSSPEEGETRFSETDSLLESVETTPISPHSRRSFNAADTTRPRDLLHSPPGGKLLHYLSR